MVEASEDSGVFRVTLDDGSRLSARAVVAAAGGFGRPHVPALPGAVDYQGQLLHVAGYRRPDPYAGQRVVVVGAGKSAAVMAAVGRARMKQATPVAPQTVETAKDIPDALKGQETR